MISFNQAPTQISTMQDYNHDDETVSLCDLPIYGFDTTCSTTDSEGSSKLGDESFEFFSKEWIEANKSSNVFPYEHMVFGRKLILPKQPSLRKPQEAKKRDHHASCTKVDLDTSTSSRNKEFAKCMSMNKGRSKHNVHDTKRVVPTSASMKSRWFGMARVPTEMDLSAIKSRQNRHRKARSNGSGKEENNSFREAKGLGLGRLIRELSCDGQSQANSMVKASLVCITRI